MVIAITLSTQVGLKPHEIHQGLLRIQASKQNLSLVSIVKTLTRTNRDASDVTIAVDSLENVVLVVSCVSEGKLSLFADSVMKCISNLAFLK